MRLASKIVSVIMTFAATFFLVLPLSHSAGIGAQFLEVAGRALGIPPLVELGRNADAEHKRFKDDHIAYKQLEEGVSNFVQLPFSLACTATFETVVGSVRAICSGYSVQSSSSSDAALIESAKTWLISLGIIRRDDFSGVSISWCNGSMDDNPLTPKFIGDGIAPNRDEIILHAKLKQDRKNIAKTIAHEMQHIFQYRRMGTGPFKCEYSQHYVKCQGCQNREHPFEKEAFEFGDYAESKLDGSLLPPSNPFQPRYFPARVLDIISKHNVPPDAKVLLAEDRARKACTVDGKIKGRAVDSCIDDLAVIYAELQDTIGQGLEGDRLGEPKNYNVKSERDRRKACSLVATGIDNSNIGQSNARRCLLQTENFIVDAIALAQGQRAQNVDAPASVSGLRIIE